MTLEYQNAESDQELEKHNGALTLLYLCLYGILLFLSIIVVSTIQKEALRK